MICICCYSEIIGVFSSVSESLQQFQAAFIVLRGGNLMFSHIFLVPLDPLSLEQVFREVSALTPPWQSWPLCKQMPLTVGKQNARTWVQQSDSPPAETNRVLRRKTGFRSRKSFLQQILIWLLNTSVQLPSFLQYIDSCKDNWLFLM